MQRRSSFSIAQVFLKYSEAEKNLKKRTIKRREFFFTSWYLLNFVVSSLKKKKKTEWKNSLETQKMNLVSSTPFEMTG